MNEPIQKKKMSTGCLVAVIVFSILLLAVIALAFYCYSNKEKLVRFGAVTVIQRLQTSATEAPQPGVDTVQVNAVADQLLAEINSEEKPNMEQLAILMGDLQNVFNDDKVDSAEVALFIRAAEAYYPGLTVPGEPPVMMDTTGATMDTSGTE